MAWTKQQQQAISARNCSLIVSAAAGSGKTAVLVERLAGILVDKENPVRADRMIAATFTNDAASELKQRLNEKLLHIINSEPENTYAIKQYTLLQNAKISTINSFCFELLRDNIGNQGIGADFTVLDDTENNIIKAECADEIKSKWCLERKNDMELLYDRFCIKDDSPITALILEFDKFLSSTAFRSKWLEDTKAEFDKPYNETVYFKTMMDDIIKELKKSIKLAENNIDMTDDIFDISSDEKIAKVAESSRAQSEDDYTRVSVALKALLENTGITEEIQTYCNGFGRLISVSKKLEYDTKLREKLKANRDFIKNSVKNTFSRLNSIEEDITINKELFGILKDMVEEYFDLLWSRKTDKNAISFDDGERLVLEMLADTDENGNTIPSEIARKISEYYDIIMIDEYQDSNDKQDMIFKLISKGCKVGNNGFVQYGKNAFLVGDVKQCIYKFRLANPENFINTLKSSEEYSAENTKENSYLKLNKNFRSSESVINSVNFIFREIMSESCGDVNYDSQEELNYGAEIFNGAVNKEKCTTQVTLINTNNDDDADDIDDEQTDETKPLPTDNPEADFTASQIRRMLDEEEPVVLKNGKIRPCQPCDFCILVRKNAYTRLYVEKLGKLGINAKGEEEKGYLNSREIAVLLDLLRIIDNPMLDIPMASVMMSPMFLFSAEDMAQLKVLDKKQNLYIIMENALSHCSGYEINSRLEEKCRDFLNVLKNFRLQAVTLSVNDLIERIYDTTDFLTVMQLFTDGEKKRANLRALINYAHTFDSNSSVSASGGLSGFVRHIDYLIESGEDFRQGKISSASDNYVSIKTIHKSKGLEFPFVFIAETNGKFRFDFPPLLCGVNNRIGFIVNYPEYARRYRSILYSQLMTKNKSDIISEEVRLLYVALTRARQKLFINLKCNNKNNALYKKLDIYSDEIAAKNGDIHEIAQQSLHLSDFLWLSLMRHQKFTDAAKLIGYEIPVDLPYRNDENVFNVKLYNPADYDEKSTVLPDAKAADSTIIKRISDMISYKYDTTLSVMPSKISVTQLAEKFAVKDNQPQTLLKRPKFISETSKLTGSERGTAIHTFFQYCCFDAAINDPESEIWHMVDKGYLSENEAEAIPKDKISAFFKSYIYKKILQSKKYVREMKFMIALNEIALDKDFEEKFKFSDGMIKGIMDLIIFETDGIILVDYKSDRTKNENMLKERYKCQLELYKKALELMTGQKVLCAYLYSFEMEKEICVL